MIRLLITVLLTVLIYLVIYPLFITTIGVIGEKYGGFWWIRYWNVGFGLVVGTTIALLSEEIVEFFVTKEEL